MVLKEQFAERLLQSMRDAGFVGHGSAARLARELSVTPKAAAKWIQGDSMPTFERIAKIADVLHVDPEWLLWGHDTDISTSRIVAGIPVVSRPMQTMILSKNGEFKSLRELGNDKKDAAHRGDLTTHLDDPDNEALQGQEEIEVPFLGEVELSVGSGRTAIKEHSSARLRFDRVMLRKHGVQLDQVVCVPVHGNSMEPVLPDGSTVAINKGATNVVDGKIYAIAHGGQLRVKTLYRLPGGGIRLRSFNQAEHPDELYNPEEMVERDIVILGRVFWSATFH